MTERAATVAAKPTPPPAAFSLQRKCACGSHTSSGDECGSCASKRVQRKAVDGAMAAEIPDSVGRVLRTSGSPLDARTRTAMEAGFGHDFSSVRVHYDAAASASARDVNALAYTAGRDVVFAQGQYAPGSAQGRRLLAHELAHVVQQRDLNAVPVGIGAAHSSLEHQADHAADRVVAGLPARGLASASAPLISREPDTRRMPAPDGGTDSVTRSVTPGKCALVPKLKSATSGDINASRAFLQIDLCKGSVAGQIRGELDYGNALQQAGQAVGKLLTNVQAGQQAQQALSTFSNDLKQVSPGAEVKLNLQASNVFRLDITGLGNASVGGGASGKGTVRAEFDTGPVNVVLEGSVAGGSNQQTNYTVTGNIVFGGKRMEAPDCRVCECSEPTIKFICSHVPPKGPPTKPPDPAEPRFVPYFFEYADTTPNPRLAPMNEKNLGEVLRAIQVDDYRIARIEGSASPEGPAKGRRGKFTNNTVLSEARAIEGKKQLDKAINGALGSFQIMRTENLKRELASGYPVVGRGELFGNSDKGEVDDPKLLAHLKKTLAPVEGQPDPLAGEHVTGKGLSDAVKAETEADAEAFRSGKRGDKKLTDSERLETIYQPLRRALIVLVPPPLPAPDLRLNQKQIDNVIGNLVPCTDAMKAQFADVPIANPFEGECKGTGKQGGGSK